MIKNMLNWLGGFHGEWLVFENGWEKKLEQAGISRGCGWRQLAPGEKVTGSKHVNTYRVELDNGETIYFKRYTYRKNKHFLRRSRAMNEVFSYAQLKKAGVPTLDAVAWGTIRDYGILRATCIVTRAIPDSEDLEQFAQNHWCSMTPSERSCAIREISSEIIKHLHLAHRRHFFHYDLKWRNILVTKDEQGVYRCTWIDCPKGRYLWLRHGRGQMVDLSALARLALSYLSRTQRLRFIYKYLGTGASRREARRLFRKIDRHLSRRMPVIFDPDYRGGLDAL